MANWLIILLSIYCGISYGVAAMLWMITGGFKLRHVFLFLLSPLVSIVFIGLFIYENIKDNW
jgi:hypothetical protein